MHEPPIEIDNAKVLHWAWSGKTPFFVMPNSGGSGGIKIYGLAICQYSSGEVYRFSCDKNWKVQNDNDWNSVEEAMTVPSVQYDVTQIKWNKRS